MTDTDYKSTLHLPQTNFPMKAGLPDREPEMLARWETIGLWSRLRKGARGQKKFILHDGPPYANGPIHIGTAMNKILKDMINRSRQMMGFDAHYIPGWDCHGLPIEWQIEQEYRKKGRSKEDVPVSQFRAECRAYADHWIDNQMADFKRLAVLGAWDRPYLTMSFHAEAQIVRELGKFLLSGALYKGAKPVMWSPVEQTALAEAEVEYKDITSTAIYARFRVDSGPDHDLTGSSVVIWTTTPWTIPGNRAIAFGSGIEYAVYQIDEVATDSLMQEGEKVVIAEALATTVFERALIKRWSKVKEIKGIDLAGTIARHPLFDEGYALKVPLYEADFVSTDQGTGFVHIAPGHGADDFELGQKHGMEVPDTVDDSGLFLPDIPLFAGQHVYKVNPEIIRQLTLCHALVATENYIHSYPHSWRSKKPVIFRNTPQWFIEMDASGLRDVALRSIDETRWVPSAGQNRIRSMVENRPDWCVSRQRAWGVPIAVFVHKETGQPLRDPAVIERVAEAVEESGADVWFTESPERFLGPDLKVSDYDQVHDILDVWFDSGSTHSFVLESDETQAWPADLYLEGSDQHRGWFHSSLLESCGTRGRAPYNEVLTHGFVMDGKGRKMSKSLGNVVAPQSIINQNGADILRLWVATTDYTEDMRIGKEIVKGLVDSYRRLRNTLRYLLGNLNNFSEQEQVSATELPELEQWILHRLSELNRILEKSIRDYTFHTFYSALHNFCSTDLSAFYFDVRKDALYCDSIHSVRRRAARSVLNHLFEILTAWLAPALPFTAEEAWLSRYPSGDGSVHLRLFPTIPETWCQPEVAQKWERIRDLRRVVTGALEVERAEKRIGSSLEASVIVYLADESDAQLVKTINLAELSIASEVSSLHKNPPAEAFMLSDVKGVGAVVIEPEGSRCVRCWQYLPSVGVDTNNQDLCERCVLAVAQ